MTIASVSCQERLDYEDYTDTEQFSVGADEGEINDTIAYDLEIMVWTREKSVMVLGLNVVKITHRSN